MTNDTCSTQTYSVVFQKPIFVIVTDTNQYILSSFKNLCDIKQMDIQDLT